MQVSIKQTRSYDQSVLAAGIGVIAFSLGLIGYIYYARDHRIETQRSLYAQYVAVNKWRTPTLHAYARMNRFINSLVWVDPSKMSGSKSMKPLLDEYAAAVSDLNGAPKAIDGPGKSVPVREQKLYKSIEAYLHELTVACTFQEDRGLRVEADETAGDKMFADWLSVHHNVRPTDKDAVAKRGEFIMKAEGLDDVSLKATVLEANGWNYRGGRLRESSGWRYEEMYQARTDLERVLNQPEVWPDGLDLAFAKSHL